VTSDKNTLRRQFLQQRQTLFPELWRSHSKSICQHLTKYHQFQAAQTVLAYQSCRQEPELSYLFTHTNKRWGLPRCIDKDLHWHSWQPSEALVTGNYGILEPNSESPQLTPDRVDLMLVPTVAIDRGGYRLGYGGGYYDRLRADPRWRKIPTIGIVFDFGYVETLPLDPWDVPLDAVCTELGVKIVNGLLDDRQI
jgi:5-formyltetrahydrofolate cyclo-ligase